jgi:hypothetical protein
MLKSYKMQGRESQNTETASIDSEHDGLIGNGMDIGVLKLS